MVQTLSRIGTNLRRKSVRFENLFSSPFNKSKYASDRFILFTCVLFTTSAHDFFLSLILSIFIHHIYPFIIFSKIELIGYFPYGDWSFELNESYSFSFNFHFNFFQLSILSLNSLETGSNVGFCLIVNRLIWFLQLNFGCNFLYDAYIEATLVVSGPNELLIIHLPG